MSKPPPRRRAKKNRSPTPYALLVAAIVVVGIAAYIVVFRDSGSASQPAAINVSATSVESTENIDSTTQAATDGAMSSAEANAGVTAASEAAAETAVSASAAPPKVAIEYPLTAATRARMQDKSMKADCPVPFQDLALLRIPHWTFEPHKTAVGELVVAAKDRDEVKQIFEELYAMNYPIQLMTLIDEYKNAKGEYADDTESINHNNTSAFNCRPVTGGSSFSKHSYGIAIDLNPIQNPYVLDGKTSHPESEPYLDRKSGASLDRKAVLVKGDAVVKLFAKYGWEWGGSWSNPIDYQHFSKGGG